MKKIIGTTFTDPDPPAQRIGSTRGAKHASPQNRLDEVRPIRTYQKGVVPSPDLALTTNFRK